MARKSLIKEVSILCMLCLTACVRDTDNMDDTMSKTIQTQDEESLVISDSNISDNDFGFAVNFQITKWPMDDFKGQVVEVSDIIRKQHEDYNPISSTLPSWWQREFDSSVEIKEYLGCEMLILPTWDLEETMATLTVCGDEEGNFVRMQIEISYMTDNIRMQSFSNIYTEFSKDDSMDYGIGQYEEDQKEEGVTSEGDPYYVVTVSENAYGYLVKEGFLIKNGVLYNFHMAYTAAYEREAEERMEKWFDVFLE